MASLGEDLALARHAVAELMAEATEHWENGNYAAWLDLRQQAAKEREYVRELKARAEEGR